jgi:hypothetical protein
MIHYLTKTIPYAYNSWVWAYDSNSMKHQFERAKRERQQLPIILREKCQPIGGNWTQPIEYYNDDSLEDTYVYKKEKIKIINNFIAENNYIIAWENKLFQILVPNISSRTD